ESRGSDRDRTLGNAGFTPDPSRRGKGGSKGRLELGAGKTELGREPVRLLHLPQHLRLADDEAVECAGHREEMAQRRSALVAIERACHGLRGGGAAPDEKRGKRGSRPRRIAGGGEELDPVAGGDERRFAQARAAEILERRGKIRLNEREAVAQLLRSGAVVDTEDEQRARRSGFADAGHRTASGKERGDPRARPAAPRSARPCRDRAKSRRCAPAH